MGTFYGIGLKSVIRRLRRLRRFEDVVDVRDRSFVSVGAGIQSEITDFFLDTLSGEGLG